jgi:hypothetical protein
MSGQERILIKAMSAIKGYVCVFEGDLVLVEEEQATACSYSSNKSFNLSWIHAVWPFPQEAQQDSAIGAMAQPSQGKRTKKLDVNSCCRRQYFMVR